MKHNTVSKLADSVTSAVKEAASQESGISPEKLHIVEVEKRTWPNDCLGLAKPGESCTQTKIEGWRVVLEKDEQTWIYRTSLQAGQIRIENNKDTYSGNLPENLVSMMLQDAAHRSKLPISELRIVHEEQQTWSNSCLGLPEAGESCAQMLVEGWRVEVEGNGQTWIYRTSREGGDLRLENKKSSNGNLPIAVANAILQQASRRLGVPKSELTIEQTEKQTWPDGCLGLAEPDEFCTLAKVEGWRASVSHDGQRIAYRASLEGGKIRMEKTKTAQTQLPEKVANGVLQKVSQDSAQSSSKLQIVESEQRTWRNSCLGLPEAGEACIQQQIQGWRVIVENDCKTWVYRTDSEGSNIRLETPHHMKMGTLPDSVVNAVLQDASEKTGLSALELQIVDAEQRTWPDRCLGLAEQGESSPQEFVEGWYIEVADRDRSLVYRTNSNGSSLRLEK